MERIDASQAGLAGFGPGLNAGAGADASAGMRGMLNQQQVVVDTADSVLTDAAEEISLHHSEKAETKHTAERKKELARPLALMSAEAIEAYVNAAEGNDGPEKLVALAKRMLAGQGDPARLARESFDNPGSQYLALQYALGQGQREGAAADVLERLQEALEDLEMSHGPRIRADINTIGAAAEEAGAPAEVARFQQAYADVVLGAATLNQTLQLVVERFGEQDFTRGLQRLTRALGQDLAAERPSAEPARLQSLVQDIYHLGVAATVLEGCQSLLSGLAARHDLNANPGAVALMKELVAVSAENWLSPTRFSSLSESYGAREVAAQIAFIGGVKSLLHEMPPQVFNDGEQRFSVFNAVQEALDVAIDREEY
ncbi:type III secretion system gatekeeper subunit SctW [Comamonas flocculans]|uniref:YopN family type III secretion system gatekeeper subunit n=1 Tax=Comamonas flocculans TaxID=2597701 RepID=A0A5B8RWT2_9BURK|nr:type III secretion system gatekeeper subunit SctW [Comamonas flocculans]QEA13174.1 YopN family type III secretion system gatekeeper subunit [Comamonas flocculans]